MHAAHTGMLQRVGAARISAIPLPVLEALNTGAVPTVNLVEFLAIDLRQLAGHVAAQIGLEPRDERLVDTLAMLDAIKPMQRHAHIARALYDLTALHPQRDEVAHRIATHPSDMARSWASYWLMCCDLPLSEKLQRVARFAADPHFGVREMAWSALRNDAIKHLDEALLRLKHWVTHDDANLRRFASELTRPRGVWCAQIEALKEQPWRAESLLEPLHADPSRYVQLSVANWLNDASRSQPMWVTEICARWLKRSDTAPTRFICQRALRTLRKQV